MASVVVLLLLFSVHRPGRSHAFSIMNYVCNNGSSYGINSTYHSNVVSLLASLSANASISAVGFAKGTLGRSPDQTWGLALCRGDLNNGTACASCLALAPDVAFGSNYCRGVRDVAVYYDRCLLRFSDKDFLATGPDDPAAPVQYSPNPDVNVTSDPGRFVGLAADLVSALSAWAARNSTARYAAGVVTTSAGEGFTTTGDDLVRNIYGLVQCTPDQSPESCLGCLGTFRDAMPAVFKGTAGGQINAVWCNLRFEIFLFYDSSPVVKLVAPPPAPPPSFHNDASAKRTRGAGNAATVVAIVLGVLVVILVSTFAIYIWRKAQVKQCELHVLPEQVLLIYLFYSVLPEQEHCREG
ncbi:unnamed protein product [Urochloa humidicola]